MKNEEIRRQFRNESALEDRDRQLIAARARVQHLEAEAEALKAALEANSRRGRAEQKLKMDLDNVSAMLAEANRAREEQVPSDGLDLDNVRAMLAEANRVREEQVPSDGLDRESGGESGRRARAGRDILSLCLTNSSPLSRSTPSVGYANS